LSYFLFKPLRIAVDEDKPLLEVLRLRLIPGLRKKLFNFVAAVEDARSTDFAYLNRLLEGADLEPDQEENQQREGHDDVESESESDDETHELKRQAKIEELQLRWKFPAPPGYVPKSRSSTNPTVEFVKSLFHVLVLDKTDPTLASALEGMRADALRLLKVKAFSAEAEFKTPLMSVPAAVLRDFECGKCGEIADIDVLTHNYVGPGLFTCGACREPLDRDALEIGLTQAAENLVAKWHEQPVVCERCRRMKYGLCPRFCACSGKFICRADREFAKNSLLVLRSVAEPHDLRILREITDNYLVLL
jgi:hypothetical protein